MTSSAIIFGGIVIYVIAVGLIVGTLYGLQASKKKSMEKDLSKLETLKNLIISSGILSEMEKVKALIGTKKLQDKYDKWEKRYKRIEEESIPKLTDELMEQLL